MFKKKVKKAEPVTKTLVRVFAIPLTDKRVKMTYGWDIFQEGNEFRVKRMFSPLREFPIKEGDLFAVPGVPNIFDAIEQVNGEWCLCEYNIETNNHYYY